MKKALTLLILLLPVMACGSKQKILSQVDGLVAQKKYLSAYSLLEQADPKNQDIDLALAKVQIALDDHLTTDLLQTFTFKDISSDQDIENFRGEKGDHQVFVLSPEALLNGFIPNNPSNWHVIKALGDYEYFYYSYYERSRNDKGVPRLKQAHSYYYQALGHDVMDAKSLYRLGRVRIDLQEYQAAMDSLNAAIEKGYKTGDSHYYLALAQFNMGELSNCVKNGETALSLYARSEEKVSAARLAAKAYMGLGDEKSAMKYFEIVSRLRPKNYDNLRSLLTVNLSHKEMDKGSALAKSMLAIQPKSRDILQDIYEAYDRFKYPKEFYGFLEKMKSSYAKQDEVMGNLYLYQAKADAGARRSNEAIDSLKKAKGYFSKALKPKDKIFKTIDDQIEQLRRKK